VRQGWVLEPARAQAQARPVLGLLLALEQPLWGLVLLLLDLELQHGQVQQVRVM
jgi:hypothetical protein